MLFSEPMSIECPEGYLPFPKPKEWNRESDGLGRGCPVLTVRIPIPEIKFSSPEPLLYELITRLNNSFELQAVYTQQLGKVNENSFRVGFSVPVCQNIIAKYKASLRDFSCKELVFTIPTSDLILYQRIKQKPTS